MADLATTKLTVDDRLGKTVFDLDHEPHIVVDYDKCKDCVDKPCVPMCPARLYLLQQSSLVFNCEGCLECGTCRVVCHAGGNGGVSWKYPRGGLGVRYKDG
jgi:ferredoxin like protein